VGSWGPLYYYIYFDMFEIFQEMFYF
jgi:hypothetical protein